MLSETVPNLNSTLLVKDKPKNERSRSGFQAKTRPESNKRLFHRKRATACDLHNRKENNTSMDLLPPSSNSKTVNLAQRPLTARQPTTQKPLKMLQQLQTKGFYFADFMLGDYTDKSLTNMGQTTLKKVRASTASSTNYLGHFKHAKLSMPQTTACESVLAESQNTAPIFNPPKSIWLQSTW